MLSSRLKNSSASALAKAARGENAEPPVCCCILQYAVSPSFSSSISDSILNCSCSASAPAPRHAAAVAPASCRLKDSKLAPLQISVICPVHPLLFFLFPILSLFLFILHFILSLRCSGARLRAFVPFPSCCPAIRCRSCILFSLTMLFSTLIVAALWSSTTLATPLLASLWASNEKLPDKDRSVPHLNARDVNNAESKQLPSVSVLVPRLLGLPADASYSVAVMMYMTSSPTQPTI